MFDVRDVPSSAGSGEADGRSISVVAWLAIVVVYLAIVQGVSVRATSGMDAEYGKFPDTEAVFRQLVIPVGTSMVFVLVVVTVLGWWRPVWKDDRPVQRWVRIVPTLLIAAVIVGTNYAELTDHAHGLWDFGLFTGKLGADLYAPTIVVLLVDLVLAVTLVVRRHHLEPADPSGLSGGRSGRAP